jgi:hypothetical protein
VSRRRYRRRRQDTFASLVDDSARFASRCGAAGALATGLIGFVFLYAVFPMCVATWMDANKTKLVGPSASAFAQVLDLVAWHRFIEPSQWAGVSTLLVCTIVALWKHLEQPELSRRDVDVLSALAKFIGSLLRRNT